MSVKVNVLTRGKSFDSALYAVRRQLKAYGCWTKPVSDLDVYQTVFSLSYGYQKYKDTGDIVIPRVSVARVWDNFFGEGYVSIRDIIRHEYAHGIAHCHPKSVNTATFKKTFGGDHDSCERSSYDPEVHVTSYAAKNPCEDFAEVFMFFLKHDGSIPKVFQGLTAVEKKWSFVKNLCSRLKKMKQGK